MTWAPLIMPDLHFAEVGPFGLRGRHRARLVPAGHEVVPVDIFAMDPLAAGLAHRVGDEFVIPVPDPAGQGDLVVGGEIA
jgi:hypothetical protein